MPAMAVADADGNAVLTVRFPAGQGAGMPFLVQALALDQALTLGSPGALQITPLRNAQIPTAGEEVDVVVLFGQSNAEGMATLAEVPVALRGAHPCIRIWNEAQSAFEPMQPGYNNTLFPLQMRVGPEIGMVEMALHLPRPVWLVKVALGQSSLGPNPGPWNEWGPQAGELYGEMVRRIGAAANAIRQLGLVPRVRLVCMMQGESDAIDPGLAQAYAGNLSDLITQMRSDLDVLDCQGKDVAWFRIGLVSPRLARVGFTEIGVVRLAQRAVALATERSDTVETRTLELAPDGVHFAFSALHELGREFLSRRPW